MSEVLRFAFIAIIIYYAMLGMAMRIQLWFDERKFIEEQRRFRRIMEFDEL